VLLASQNINAISALLDNTIPPNVSY